MNDTTDKRAEIAEHVGHGVRTCGQRYSQFSFEVENVHPDTLAEWLRDMMPDGWTFAIEDAIGMRGSLVTIGRGNSESPRSLREFLEQLVAQHPATVAGLLRIVGKQSPNRLREKLLGSLDMLDGQRREVEEDRDLLLDLVTRAHPFISAWANDGKGKYTTSPLGALWRRQAERVCDRLLGGTDWRAYSITSNSEGGKS